MTVDKAQKVPSGRRFLGTYNNYKTSDLVDIPAWLSSLTKCLWVFQQEIGESGTPHLQLYVEFKTPRQYTWQDRYPTIHWEKCKGTPEECVAYCTKVETRDPSVRSNGWFTNRKDIEEEVDDWLAGEEFYPWQSDLKAILLGDRKTKKARRVVYWVVDEQGGQGKTAFVRHMVLKHSAMMADGKASDVKFLLAATKPKPKIVLWNLVRTQEGFVSYSAIEAVKDGAFVSTKYECAGVMFNAPHIVIFANFAPDRSALSEDRWIVWDLSTYGIATMTEEEGRARVREPGAIAEFMRAETMRDLERGL